MRNVQPDRDRVRKVGCEDLLCCLRVGPDVELGVWRDIAGAAI